MFTATDEDGDDLTFELREGVSRDLFVINDVTKVEDGKFTGELRVKIPDPTIPAHLQGLDYDDPDKYSKETGHRVHVEVQDGLGLSDTLLLEIKLNNVNDKSPEFNVTPALTLSVPENTARGIVLANYGATDDDGDTVKYTLSGDDAKSFKISDTGDLMTLESLDADRQVPCGAGGCTVTVTANDMPDAESGAPVASHKGPATAAVVITITAIEDSVSTLDVTKANPVPGTEMGNPMSSPLPARRVAAMSTSGTCWTALECLTW